VFLNVYRRFDGGSWYQHVNRAMLLTEIGPNLARFPTAAAFCSWLRLCPDPKISGGQVLSSRTRPTKNRAALGATHGNPRATRSDTFLKDYFRRMKARMGVPKALTATAHKLARIVYHMVTTRQEYDATIFQQQEQRRSQQKTARLHAQARKLGFHLVPPLILFLRRAAGGFALASPLKKGVHRNRKSKTVTTNLAPKREPHAKKRPCRRKRQIFAASPA